jgi:hypothetical protein
MDSYVAHIDRPGHQPLDGVEVHLLIREPHFGRRVWRGEFVARSADGFLPRERIRLTLANGRIGVAEIDQTQFEGRTPETTLVQFTGSGPLSALTD